MAEEELRTKFLNKYAENIKNNVYEEEDVKRVEDADTVLLKAYIEHHKGVVDETVPFMDTALQWRKSYGVKNLTEDSFPKSLLDDNVIFFSNTSKKGETILHIQCVKMKKDSAYTENAKRLLVWRVERHFQNHLGQRMVVLYDMSGTGINNVDTNFIKFLITCFTDYYPATLAYLLLVDMPWILNAVWAVIKNWLTEEQREYVRVVKKAGLEEFIDKDQLFRHLGGNNHSIQDPIKEKPLRIENSISSPVFRNHSIKKTSTPVFPSSNVLNNLKNGSEKLIEQGSTKVNKTGIHQRKYNMDPPKLIEEGSTEENTMDPPELIEQGSTKENTLDPPELIEQGSTKENTMDPPKLIELGSIKENTMENREKNLSSTYEKQIGTNKDKYNRKSVRKSSGYSLDQITGSEEIRLPLSPRSSQIPQNNIFSVFVDPKDYLEFDPLFNMTSYITIANSTSKYLAYKIKSTSPDIFKVVPHLGIVKPEETIRIKCTAIADMNKLEPLVETMQVSLVHLQNDDELLQQPNNINVAWDSLPRSHDTSADHRIECRLDEYSMEYIRMKEKRKGHPEKTLDDLSKEIAQLKKLIIITLFLASFPLVVMLNTYLKHL